MMKIEFSAVVSDMQLGDVIYKFLSVMNKYSASKFSSYELRKEEVV